MKGDFSNWRFAADDNYSGVLHQQGRVLLDQDWNDATRIAIYHREALATATIGSDVVAVAAAEHDSLKVVSAKTDGMTVGVRLLPGRAWLDGILLHRRASGSVEASYLEPPVQAPVLPSSIAAGVRDAVVLELWQEPLSAFQAPDRLLEPALGGPDTTERVQVAHRLRLLRLRPGEDCSNLADRLRDDFAAKGKLTVTAAPAVTVAGDCPVENSGGYTGFEHYLYRIEIAQPDTSGNARFKWSRHNGGLVGRATINLAGDQVTLTANDQMINHTGATSYYLEALRGSSDGARWEVVFSADAAPTGDGNLTLSNTDGTWPAASGNSAFIRLWDGIEPIPDYLSGSVAPELDNGIELEFDAPAAGNTNYRPGDYWVFPARAAGVPFDPAIWPTNARPKGIHYHRAPLAILDWNAVPPVTLSAPDDISDCRRIFRPLTNQKRCCSYTVGDGAQTHGDFDSIQEAVDRLPQTGGEICLLPGVHFANVNIDGRSNIKIVGCDKMTRVLSEPARVGDPVFHIRDSQCISVLHLDVAALGGTAIRVDGNDWGDCAEIVIADNRVLACDTGIHVQRASDIRIRSNLIRVLDKADARVGIYLLAEDAIVERNTLGVTPAPEVPPPEVPGDDDGTQDPTDPCADPAVFYANIGSLVRYFINTWGFTLQSPPQDPFEALGGIQVGPHSERIGIYDNDINGGAGNGITLGGGVGVAIGDGGQDDDDTHEIDFSGKTLTGAATVAGAPVEGVVLFFTRADGVVLSASTDTRGLYQVAAAPGTYVVTVGTPGYTIDPIQFSAAGSFYNVALNKAQTAAQGPDAFGPLFDLRIDRNRIRHMGLSGIGYARVVATTPTVAGTTAVDDLIGALLGSTVDTLRIHANSIHDCLQNPFDAELLQEAAFVGLGGISLGACDDVVIDDNRIEHNGLRHVDPVCGIFVAWGEQLQILHNHIVDNGPLAPGSTQDILEGRRGGIFAWSASFEIGNSLVDERRGLGTGRPACRIHDNVVQQPTGQALALAAFGPASICHNHFNAELTGPTNVEILAGSVLVLGVGLDNANADVMFNDNQIRLGTHSDSFMSQVVLTTHDIVYEGNQCDALTDGLPLSDNVSVFAHVFLRGETLRATTSRLREPIEDGFTSLIASLLTQAELLNSTSGNQANHCIFAAVVDPTHPVLSGANQILDDRLCANLVGGFTDAVTGVQFTTTTNIG